MRPLQAKSKPITYNKCYKIPDINYKLTMAGLP